MATPKEMTEIVLDPIQSLWNPPFQSDEAMRKARLESLYENLKDRSAADLLKARRYLERTHDKGTWPQVPAWLKALDETRDTPAEQGSKEPPWIANRKRAEQVFDETFAKGPLSEEARAEGWFADYRAAMIALIKGALAAGKPANEVYAPAKAVEHWRAQAKRNKEAAAYRQTAAYKAVHGDRSGIDHRKLLGRGGAA